MQNFLKPRLRDRQGPIRKKAGETFSVEAACGVQSHASFLCLCAAQKRILRRDLADLALPNDEAEFVVELLEDLEGSLGADHLLWGNLRRKQHTVSPDLKDTFGFCHTIPWSLLFIACTNKRDALTGMLNQEEIWFALSWLRFSELVTKTTGTWTSPDASCSRLRNAICAAGIGMVPRASTPSTSKHIPNLGCNENNTRDERTCCVTLGEDTTLDVAQVSRK